MAQLADDMLKHRGGEFRNNLLNILSNMNELDTTISLASNSPYIDAADVINHMKSFKNKFTVLTLNIQSLPAKFDRLTTFLDDLSAQQFFFSAICIQESWLCDQNIDVKAFNIPNYNMISMEASVSKHSGLVTYVHSSFQYEIVELYEKTNLWEGLFINIVNEKLRKKITLGNIYRPPRDQNEDLRKFLEGYCQVISKIADKNNDIIITGDFNIDLLQLTSREVFSEYLDAMLSFSLSPILTLPTRFSKRRATLIDHIFYRNSNLQQPVQSGIILKQLSDHCPAFIALDNNLCHPTPEKFITLKHLSSQAETKFKAEVECIDFESLLNNDKTADPQSNLEILNSILVNAKNNHLLEKKVKFNRHKHKINPWITFGIIKSIKYRDSMYKRLHQVDPDSIEYSNALTNLKSYNRILNRSIRKAKFSYYNNLLSAHKNDSKKTWQTLKNIMKLSKNINDFPKFFMIDNNKISNADAIAEHFNKYFASIGPLLASSLKHTDGHNYRSYLNNSIDTIFEFQEIDASQIILILNNMKPKSSTDHNGLSTKLL